MAPIQHDPADAGHGAGVGDVASALLAAERAAVAARIADLSGDVAAMVEASAGSNADDEHDPEGATIAFERAQLLALRESAQAHLAQVDAALDRLRAGTYGVCAVCGRPIDPARLAARPEADRCVTC
jgi:RNA polymerase-binding transcription factor DksA